MLIVKLIFLYFGAVLFSAMENAVLRDFSPEPDGEEDVSFWFLLLETFAAPVIVLIEFLVLTYRKVVGE